MISGPRSTWIGRLSAAVSSSWRAVSTTHEKSRAIVRMPERPVRCSVFAILRAMPSNRAVSTASCAPLMGFGRMSVMVVSYWPQRR